jgi:cytochrome c-type biogenesis protein
VPELLSSFGNAFAGPAAWAVPAAIAWGMLSVFLSPCHLSGIPLVVAYMNGGGAFPDTRRALRLSASFAAGTVASIAVVGAATVTAGRIAGDVGAAGSYALAAVFFAVGLHLLGVISWPSWAAPASSRRRGAAGALLLGLVFGAALGPCTFAFMAPLLGLVFAAGRADAAPGVLLVASYAAGHAAAIILAGASAQGVQRWLSSRAGAGATTVLRGAAGAAVILGGLYFLYTAR